MFCVLAGTRPDPPPNDWHPRQGESRTNFLAATSVNHHLIMVMMMVMMVMMVRMMRMIATLMIMVMIIVFDDWLPPQPSLDHDDDGDDEVDDCHL